jgi:uncharacterized membrane protein HdeD (DUF308 family)
MSTANESSLADQLRHDLTALRGNWFWFVLLGFALVVMGSIALSAVGIASLATAAALGALLLVSGLFEVVGAFWSRRWSGFFLHLLSGVLSVVVGMLFLRAPVDALLVLTLLVACLLMVSGIFKIVAALSHRFAMWGWTLVSGLLDLFLGITLIFRGVNWIALGFGLRSLPGNPAV